MPAVLALSANPQRAVRALALLMHAEPATACAPPLPDPCTLAMGQGLGLGHVHECDIELEGRRGTWIEQCTELAPCRRLTWAVVSDNLGFSAALEQLVFRFEIHAVGRDRSLVTMQTLYRPRHLVARLQHLLVLRPLFHRRGHRTLSGLKAWAERSPCSPRRAAPLGCAPPARSELLAS
ncbi:hypothetical protein [Inhella proteolytica]|uniref:DUF2867 domain-containing protein n=1 Tax=Inhella proteolytica TaxID=2795029 RepID=A0A931J8V5_9BURK|nr:hypothetical protein [Inhella proteolytica]MBH9578512.1 hypothetical protein [Inhella proteolytica]